jgi:hypothetical protein
MEVSSNVKRARRRMAFKHQGRSLVAEGVGLHELSQK